MFLRDTVLTLQNADNAENLGIFQEYARNMLRIFQEYARNIPRICQEYARNMPYGMSINTLRWHM